MGTWLGVIAETKGRDDFWIRARPLGLELLTIPTGPRTFIDTGHDFEGTFTFAEALSRQTGVNALAFVVQTTADAHELRAYEQGLCVRQLSYTRDYGGWIKVEGSVQAWERAYFFEGDDLLWDEATDDELARFAAAKKAGDVTSVISLCHPSSTAPMHRVCEFLQLDANVFHGKWKKPSRLAWLFR